MNSEQLQGGSEMLILGDLLRDLRSEIRETQSWVQVRIFEPLTESGGFSIVRERERTKNRGWD